MHQKPFVFEFWFLLKITAQAWATWLPTAGPYQFYMHYKYSTHKHSNTDLSLIKLFKGSVCKNKPSPSLRSHSRAHSVTLSLSLLLVSGRLFLFHRLCQLELMSCEHKALSSQRIVSWVCGMSSWLNIHAGTHTRTQHSPLSVLIMGAY